ncbi:MAG: dockerin type I domain-containing protein [Phycisphaerales bacterium]|nr:dockerin type I domain-containing protein [Phycisphaerales bacterium]MCI0676026.1 dockerin type I domain-containing protein [Phycisphaerales bacterium]
MRFDPLVKITSPAARAIPVAGVALLAFAAASFGDISIVTEVQKLVASDGAAEDKFGFAIDREGDLMVIGAPQHYTNSLPGSIYLFARDQGGVWTQQERIFSPFRAGEAEFGDVFGTDVALEGDTILVGAPFVELNGTMLVGLVYVYTRDAGGTWSQQQTLLPGGPNIVRFGELVEAVGDTAVIAGLSRVFVFSRDAAGTWSEQEELSGLPFGVVGSIAFDGQAIIVGNGDIEGQEGEPQAVVFSQVAGAWQVSGQMNTSVDGFMTTVRDIGLDGNQAVLGVLDLADQDRAFVFDGSEPGSWAQEAMLDPDSIDDSFGADVVIAGDLLLVGAPHGGLTYMYTRDGAGAWAEHMHLEPSDNLSKNFGDELHFQNSIPIVGSWAHHQNGLYSGAVYVFGEISIPVAGDVTGDGVVNIDDLLAVIAAWGSIGPNAADVTGDGQVNVHDLLMVISNWG